MYSLYVAKKVNISQSDKNITKAQVIAVVDTWIAMNPSQYEMFKKQVEAKRMALKDPRWGEIKTDTVEALFYSMPEEVYYALESAFTTQTSDDDMNRLRSQWFRSHEGSEWFCKRFPEFAYPKGY